MSEIKTDSVSVVFEEGSRRSAAYCENALIGECEFSVAGSVWTITHTGVRPEFGVRGIAKALVLCVIENARAKGARIVPLCSYAAKMMVGKEEFSDVI